MFVIFFMFGCEEKVYHQEVVAVSQDVKMMHLEERVQYLEERLAQFSMFLEMHVEAPNPFDVLRLATTVMGEKHNENKYRILSQQA